MLTTCPCTSYNSSSTAIFFQMTQSVICWSSLPTVGNEDQQVAGSIDKVWGLRVVGNQGVHPLSRSKFLPHSLNLLHHSSIISLFFPLSPSRGPVAIGVRGEGLAVTWDGEEGTGGDWGSLGSLVQICDIWVEFVILQKLLMSLMCSCKPFPLSASI